MSESIDRQPTQVMTRLDMMTKGAAVLMVCFLGIGAGVAIAKGGDPSALNVGLHLINMGIVMVIAVGAPANHRSILEGQQQIQARQDRIERKLDDLSETLSRIVRTSRDEVGDQRHGHN